MKYFCCHGFFFSARTPDILTLCRTKQKCRGQVRIRLKIDSVGSSSPYNHIGFATESSGAYSMCGFNSNQTAYLKIDTGEVFCPDGSKKGLSAFAVMDLFINQKSMTVFECILMRICLFLV